MNLDVLVKYLIWVAFFVIVLVALYLTFKKIGVL